jgi:hypothetical protein
MSTRAIIQSAHVYPIHIDPGPILSLSSKTLDRNYSFLFSCNFFVIIALTLLICVIKLHLQQKSQMAAINDEFVGSLGTVLFLTLNQ